MKSHERQRFTSSPVSGFHSQIASPFKRMPAKSCVSNARYSTVSRGETTMA